jgi:hypothetical protein
MKLLIPALAATAVMVFAAFMPISPDVPAEQPVKERASMDLSPYASDPPESSIRFLFIHHSCGGQWLSSAGHEVGDGAACIFQSHPNGGNLRAALEHQGYEVHEAAYGSKLGQDTDLFDWLPKFERHMPTLLRLDHQDDLYADDRRNNIIAFKSCYPNNAFVGEGEPPGSPRGRELTLWNAKATMSALLPLFEARPEVLFVYVTAPPLAARIPAVPAWKVAARALLGRPQAGEVHAQRAAIARSFHEWVNAPEGWLSDYPLKNVAVFDYYDVLTAGRSNLSAFPTGDGSDSHPSSHGNQLATQAFVPFLNRAVRRAGMLSTAAPSSHARQETP